MFGDETRTNNSPASDWTVVGRILARTEDGPVIGRLEMPTRQPASCRCRVGSARGSRRDFDHHAAFLLAAAGHDLRQPLQVITMVLDRLAPSLGGRDGQLAAIARAEAQRATDGLTDLALTSRFGPRAPRRTLVPIGSMLQKAAEGWRHHAQAKSLALKLVKSDAEVVVDPSLLMTILRNLVGNAVQHTNAGGVLIGCRRSGSTLRVDVVDTGPGIPPGDLARIFESFEPGMHSHGLGLGLALAQEAADQLGAQLSVATAVGRGTRFSVRLPLAPSSERSRRSA